MTTNPSCPKCKSQHAYTDGNLWICPECAHEWQPTVVVEAAAEDRSVRDAHGNILQEGDSISVVKDLNVKGASKPLKVGTKAKNIRVNPDGPDGHNISCKIEGFGVMNLKSEFVKKI